MAMLWNYSRLRDSARCNASAVQKDCRPTFVSQGNASAALSYLRQISDRQMRVYARTSPKFDRLRGDPDFERITQ